MLASAITPTSDTDPAQKGGCIFEVDPVPRDILPILALVPLESHAGEVLRYSRILICSEWIDDWEWWFITSEIEAMGFIGTKRSETNPKGL